MTPEQFKYARKSCGMSVEAWAHALGYEVKNPRQFISGLETGQRNITPPVARLAEMYASFGVPDKFKKPQKPY